MVRERAPSGGHAEHLRTSVLASQVVLDSALVESFNRVLLSGRSLVFSAPHRVCAPQGPRTCGGPARVADGQAVGLLFEVRHLMLEPLEAPCCPF